MNAPATRTHAVPWKSGASAPRKALYSQTALAAADNQRKPMKLHKLTFLLIILSLAAHSHAQSAFDLVITNGHIIDGTGSPWYSGDLGIRDGKVAAIGNLTAAPRKRTIDAAGKVVAPGFIDMLGQSELSILVEARLP